MLATLITYTLYVATALIPFIFTTWNYELFEFPKFIILIATSLFAGILMLGDHIFNRKNPFIIFWQNRPTLTKLLHISIVSILLTQALATLTSVNVHTSLWGYYGRFHQGLIATICYTVLYFAASLYLNKKSTQNIIKVSLSTSIIISLYAIAERTGVDKNVWIQDVQNRVFSTLGQPNWLAAYLLPNYFLVLYHDHIKKHQGQNNPYLYTLLSITIFLALLFTKSRSGLAAFFVSYLLYWATMYRNFGWHNIKIPVIRNSIPIILLTLIIGNPLFSLSTLFTKTKIAPTATGPVLETGGTESGEIRRIVWSGALELVKHYPLLGTGPETFAYTYYQVRPIAHNYVSEWDFLYNKAHNEYLNIAATTGLVGLGGYLSFHLALTLLGLKKTSPAGKKVNDDNYLYHNAFAPVVLATIASFAITNFFGFSVIPVYLLTTLLAALTNSITTINNEQSVTTSAHYVTLALASIALILPLRLYLADTDFAKGKKLADSGHPVEALPLLESAHQAFPSFDLYLTTLSESYATIGVALSQQKDATPAAYQPYLNRAFEASRQLLSLNSIHQNNLKSAAKVALLMSSVKPDYYQYAGQYLESAARLAPTDPKVFYNLGLIYSRLGEDDKAIQALKKSIELRRIYAEPYYALTLVYEETKQTALIPPLLKEAKENLATYSPQLKGKIDQYAQ